jgi:PRTRC genetic system protein A
LAQWPEIARAFELDAQRAIPNEVAACVVRQRDGSLSYRLSETVSATPTHVRAQRRVEPDEEVIFDLHSHPACGAFFSDTDREDMGSEVVLAGVLGRSEAGWEWRVSLFARGHEIQLET